MYDVNERATWRKEEYHNDGRNGFGSSPQKRSMVIQLEGPNRHDGEIIEDHRGIMRLKMSNGKTYKAE